MAGFIKLINTSYEKVSLSYEPSSFLNSTFDFASTLSVKYEKLSLIKGDDDINSLITKLINRTIKLIIVYMYFICDLSHV